MPALVAIWLAMGFAVLILEGNVRLMWRGGSDERRLLVMARIAQVCFVAVGVVATVRVVSS